MNLRLQMNTIRKMTIQGSVYAVAMQKLLILPAPHGSDVGDGCVWLSLGVRSGVRPRNSNRS